MLKPIIITALPTCGAARPYAQTAPQSQPTAPITTPAPAAPTERTVSTGNFNTSGDMSASALIGAKVRNANKETVGTVDDFHVDRDATIKAVVVSVGGFLGVGAKDVAVKWSDITFGRDEKSVILTTSLTKEQLLALPDHVQAERRQTVPAETANGPPLRPDRAPTRWPAPSAGSVSRQRQPARSAAAGAIDRAAAIDVAIDANAGPAGETRARRTGADPGGNADARSANTGRNAHSRSAHSRSADAGPHHDGRPHDAAHRNARTGAIDLGPSRAGG